MTETRKLSNATRTWATGPASSDTTKVNKLSMMISQLSHTFSCRNNLFVTKFVSCGVFFPRRRDHGARMLDQGQGWLQASTFLSEISATRVSLTLRACVEVSSPPRCTTRSARRTATGREPRSSATATFTSATERVQTPSMPSLSFVFSHYGDFVTSRKPRWFSLIKHSLICEYLVMMSNHHF